MQFGGVTRRPVEQQPTRGTGPEGCPEVWLWEVCRPDLVTPVTRRSRKPLGRIVGNPPTEIEAAWASAQGSNGCFPSTIRPKGQDLTECSALRLTTGRERKRSSKWRMLGRTERRNCYPEWFDFID